MYAIPAILILAFTTALYFSSSLRAAWCPGNDLVPGVSLGFLLDAIRCQPGISYPALAAITIGGLTSRSIGKYITALSFASWQQSITEHKTTTTGKTD